MMKRCGTVLVVCAGWLLVACGGSKASAGSPADEAPAVETPAVETELEDGEMQMEGEAEADEPEVEKQELPCPGKKARYWDSGLVRSEVLTEDCEINGESFPAGTLLEFDDEGVLVTE